LAVSGNSFSVWALISRSGFCLFAQVGAVVTHYHFDHTGGTPPPPFDQFGIKVPGIRELAIEDKVPVYINKHDAETVKHQNDVPTECMTLLEVPSVNSNNYLTMVRTDR
jgi:metal-dependent hydrolase (beta-lactamase superfamily II)